MRKRGVEPHVFRVPNFQHVLLCRLSHLNGRGHLARVVWGIMVVPCQAGRLFLDTAVTIYREVTATSAAWCDMAAASTVVFTTCSGSVEARCQLRPKRHARNIDILQGFKGLPKRHGVPHEDAWILGFVVERER